MSERQVPASNVYGLKAAVGQMKWKAKVCFLELDVTKATEVNSAIRISIRCNTAAGERFERRAVKLVKQNQTPYGM